MDLIDLDQEVGVTISDLGLVDEPAFQNDLISQIIKLFERIECIHVGYSHVT